MVVTIAIDTSNAAFHGPQGEGAEVARILKDVAQRMEDYADLKEFGHSRRLYDGNGNAVGCCDILAK